ncbi:MAG: Ig-like domain-containing protein, partial [Dokdonella sp.]
MRRLAALLLATPFVLAWAAPPWQQNGDGNPSILDPSVPLSYVGNDGSVSLGINGEGRTEGQLLGVFARSNERAVIGQLWWDRASAGGIQTDFNWLWGMSALEAREHPEAATIARLSFAIDQNAEHDRKATLGFGIERREFAIDAYLAGGISSTRNSGGLLTTSSVTQTGTDTIGSYAQIDTTAVQTLFGSKPYGAELGLQVSHVFEPMALRVHGGASVQHGDGAHANTVSIGLDTPLGTRGWGLSALGEHLSRHGGLDAGDDDRLSVYLRYEFGSRGSFVPTGQLEDPAWIARALGHPSSAHPRVVDTYQVRRSQTTTVTHGPKQYSNRFPIAHDDSAGVSEGQTASIDVLANDSDPDGDPLAISAVTAAAHGVTAISGTHIVYTPSAGYAGSDRFRYTVSDSRGGSATATVSVTLAARTNQAPIARNDTATTSFGQPITIDVLANDSDADGDPLNILDAGAALRGRVAIAGRALVYTPAPGFDGSDHFTYTIGDGRGGSASATVTIQVAPRPDRAPVAQDDAASTAFEQAVSIDVLANDSDPDGDAFSLLSVTAPLHGTAAKVGNRVLYTPAAGFVGVDAFRYTINDGRGGSATAAVSVTVAAQPDRAPVAVDDAATTPLGQAVTIAVLANDSDADGDALSIVGVTTPASGSAVISGTTIVYTPTAAGAAIDRFSYTISDGRGGRASANVVVAITPPPNRPPVAVDDAATTQVGQAVTIGVLANDSDPDGDPLAIASVTAPAAGTVAIAGNSVVYTPFPRGLPGIDRFSYTI